MTNRFKWFIVLLMLLFCCVSCDSFYLSKINRLIEKGLNEELNELLQKGVDIGAPESENYPLKTAAEFDNDEAAKLLIQYGANTDFSFSSGQQYMDYLVENEKRDLIQEAVLNGVDCNIFLYSAGEKILIWAINNGDFDLIESLIRHGSEAVLSKEYEIAEKLLNHKEAVWNQESLDLAWLEVIRRWHDESANFAQMLLSREKFPSANLPLLSLAVSSISYDAAKWLLEHGYSPEGVYDSGAWSLKETAIEQYEDRLHRLVNYAGGDTRYDYDHPEVQELQRIYKLMMEYSMQEQTLSEEQDTTAAVSGF